MFRQQDHFTSLHASHYAPQPQPPTPQQDLEARLAEAKARAIAAIRRPHQPMVPTPLHQVQVAEEESLSQGSPCPTPYIKPGQGRSLFEHTSFRKPVAQNERKEGRSLEERVSWAPPTGPRAEREIQDRGWGFAQSRSSSAGESGRGGETTPFSGGKQDPQGNGNAGSQKCDWQGLYKDAAAVATKAAELPSPVPSPWNASAKGGLETVQEEYAPPPAATPPPAPTAPAAFLETKTGIETQQQPGNNGYGNGNRPPPLDLGRDALESPLYVRPVRPFQSLASAVWKFPESPSFVPPKRAPLPKNAGISDVHRRAEPAAPPSQGLGPPTMVYQPPPTQQQSVYPSAMPHISATSALSFSPPLTPALSSSSSCSQPQLSTSIYLKCLAAQGGENVKVMLKCGMQTCGGREGVSFAGGSWRGGVVERYREMWGCGGCGERLEVQVC